MRCVVASALPFSWSNTTLGPGGEFAGGPGEDRVLTNEASGVVHGGPGDDVVTQNHGHVFGDGGNDYVSPNFGSVWGGDGRDYVVNNHGDFYGESDDDLADRPYDGSHFDGGAGVDSVAFGPDVDWAALTATCANIELVASFPLFRAAELGILPSACPPVDEIPTTEPIRITLAWTAPAILDLHVVEPDGDNISSTNTTSDDGARWGANPDWFIERYPTDCTLEGGQRSEAVYYLDRLPPDYLDIYIDVVDDCDGPIPEWTLRIDRYAGHEPLTITDSIDMATGSSNLVPTTPPIHVTFTN